MTSPVSRKHEGNSAKWLRLRLLLLGAASALGYLLIVARIRGHPVFLRWGFPLPDFLTVFLLHFVPLFLLAMAGAWWTFRGNAEEKTTLGLILGFALLFRLLLLPTPPVLSSDIYRYIWDARIQASGLNPYLSRPADFDNEAVRKDPLYQQQNRPFARTIYPPLAQAAFRAVRAVGGESVTAMKALMLLGDLASILILLHLLRSLGLPRSRVILYAWHPLAVFEIAGSGHVDALAIPFILLAVLAWQRGKDAVAGVALGAAALIKIYPILLLPAFLARRRWPLLLGCGATVLLGYLPLLPGTGWQILGHLPRYLADPYEVFNPSLMGLVILLVSRLSTAPVLWASWIGRAALLGALIWIVRREAGDPQAFLARIFVVATAATLFTLTLHPWYLLWIVPFLAMQPRPAWISLSVAVALSYAFYVVAPSTRILIGVLEYLPFLLLLCWQARFPGVLTPAAVRLGLAREIP
ncbi:MAG: hypothetical protein A3H39_14850 [candidate division NC10 bacterium RIFCSPLOWO2_02_FULL_66_22]|nr:MAG: hypothetical protein A3H39_14850 [candidate division NC10 bacterium RIFCSPLOWO2_02_FULL_66_22]